MYKIINLAGRISLFFVIEVAMYYAMIDPLLRIISVCLTVPHCLSHRGRSCLSPPSSTIRFSPFSITTRAPMPMSNKFWR